MENFVPHQDGERVVLVSVTVQILEDLDAEEFQLLAESAGAEVLQHVHTQRSKPDAKLLHWLRQSRRNCCIGRRTRSQFGHF